MSHPEDAHAGDVARRHVWWWRRGFDGALLTGCPPDLLEEMATERRSLRLEPEVEVEIGFVPAATFLAGLVAHGGQRRWWWLSVPSGVEVPVPADADPWLARLEALWDLLNRGHTLLLVPGERRGPSEDDTADVPAGSDEPAGQGPAPVAGTSPLDALASGRLPPLRTEAPTGIQSVPTHLVIVAAGDAEATAVADGVGRLLAEVPDARFSVPDASPATRDLLAARFRADPRYLDVDGIVPPATPYLVHTSLGLSLTSAVLANLVARGVERDVSVVRVLLSEAGEGPGHLSLTRLAAVHKSHGPFGQLRPSSGALAPGGLDEVARVAGIDWALPDQVGLETPATDRGADVLGASGAMPARELSLVGRLQRKVVATERERDELTAKLSEETRARTKAEESLERLRARKVVRLSDRLGRARSRLTR